MRKRVILNSYVLGILIATITSTSFAQGFDINEIIPDSPTTSQFEEIVNPTINEFSGKANIDIPIYSIDVGGYTLPISLKYDTGGFQVGEEASWVGHSWSLIAGGVISRTQISLPDDISNDIINAWTLTPVQNPITGTWESVLCSTPQESSPAGWLYNHQVVENRAECIEDGYPSDNAQEWPPECHPVLGYYMSRGGLDFAPDIFNIAMPNLSSNQFFFSSDDRAEFLDKANVKVSYDIANEQEGISEFKIYDEKGNTFVFEEREYMRYQRDYWNTGRFPGLLNTSRFEPIVNTLGILTSFVDFWSAYGSAVCSGNYDPAVEQYMNRLWPKAWYISEIITSRGKVIEFEYDREEYYTLGVTQMIHEYLGSVTSPLTGSTLAWIFDFANTNRLQQIDAPRLKKIKWDEGEIAFNANTLRQDVYTNTNSNLTHNVKKLDEIVIRDNNNNLIKRFVFNHSYNLAQGYNASMPEHKKTVYKRLWLNSIDCFDKAGALSGGYDFTYDNSSLPNKFSFEQDYWGYYNNNNANSFVPNLWYYPSENDDYLDKGKVSLYPRDSHVGPEQRTNDFVTSTSTGTFNVADRRPNPTFSKAGVLKKINYFLGGEVEFEYEGNEFLYRGQTVNGPGIRVKRTLLKENDIYPAIITDYVYDFGGSTTGKIATLPIFTGNRYQISSAPYNSIDLGLNGDFGYTRIEKIYSNNNIGKEISEYSFPVEAGTVDYTTASGDNLYKSAILNMNSSHIYPDNPNPPFNPYFPFGYETNFSMARGKLLSRKTFDNAGNLLSETQNTYDFHSNYDVTKAIFFSVIPSGETTVRYLSADYNMINQDNLLTASSGDINTSTSYDFDNNHQLALKTTTNSDGKVIEEAFKYPSDFESSYSYFTQDIFGNWTEVTQYNVYWYMTDRNMLDYPIETVKRVNGNVVSSQINLFKNFASTQPGGTILPSSVYSLETNQFPYTYTYATALANSSGSNVNMDNNMTKKITFNSYAEGNVQQYEKADDQDSFILWGYNRTKPIAIVEGAHIGELNTWLSLDYGETIHHISDLSNVDANQYSEQTLRTWLNNLRNAIENHSQTARVKTYTYDPLVGLKSETDERGYSTYYEYDNFNRLKLVKDDSGNILSEYEYNYKN